MDIEYIGTEHKLHVLTQGVNPLLGSGKHNHVVLGTALIIGH